MSEESSPNPVTLSTVVTTAMTARSVGSGDMEVLGTPALIALCEQASVEVSTERLGPGETSVGIRVEFDHSAPVGVGDPVEVEAELETAHDRTLEVRVRASSEGREIGTGLITRVVVDRQRFLDRLQMP